MHFALDQLLDLGLPGLVFLGLCVWLIRKAVKAARTERDLEEERLEGTLADELRAGRARAGASQRSNLMAVATPPDPPADPLAGADLRGALPAHLLLVAELLRAESAGTADVPRRVEVLWVRSNESHAVWCERRHSGTTGRALSREVICVAQVEGGAIAERWSFG